MAMFLYFPMSPILFLGYYGKYISLVKSFKSKTYGNRITASHKPILHITQHILPQSSQSCFCVIKKSCSYLVDSIISREYSQNVIFSGGIPPFGHTSWLLAIMFVFNKCLSWSAPPAKEIHSMLKGHRNSLLVVIKAGKFKVKTPARCMRDEPL